AASAAGMTVVGVEVGNVAELDGAFAALVRERPDAMLVSNDPFHQLHIARIIEFMTANRLPGMFQASENVAAGGLMAYGASLPDLFRRAAGSVPRIQHGPGRAALPIELPTKFDLAGNLKRAKAIGVELPPTLLVTANEVVE